MKLKVLSGFFVIGLLYLMQCALPIDPATDVKNTSIQIKRVDDAKYEVTDTAKVRANVVSKIELELNLPNLIDSIQIVIRNASNQAIDTSYMFNGPFNITEIKSIRFPVVGLKRANLFIYNKNVIVKEGVFYFNVLPEPDIKITKVNGSAKIDTLNTNVNTEFTLDIQFTVPEFTDSILISVYSDLQILRISPPWQGNSFQQKMKISLPGIHLVNVQAFCRTVVKADSMIINASGGNVIDDDPIWGFETINIASIKGEKYTANLKAYTVLLPPSTVNFNLQPSKDVTLFELTDSLLSSKISTDTGHYVLKCAAVKGTQIDTVTINWNVMVTTGVVTARNDTVSVMENGNVLIDALKNDTITYGTMKITQISKPSRGNAQIVNDKIVYVPDTNAIGIDSIMYKVNVNDSAFVHIKINPAVYTLKNDTIIIGENGSGSIKPLANDAVSLGTLKITDVTSSLLGKVTFNDTSITVKADSGKNGLDSIRYIVNKGRDSALVFIIIQKTKYTLIDDTVSVLQNDTRSIDVLQNDTISTGKLVLHSVLSGKLGAASRMDSLVVYKADSNKTGTDTLIYYVNNKNDSARVIISIIPIQITTRVDSLTISEDAGSTPVDVMKNDSISHGSLVLTSVSNGKLGKAIISNSKIIYTPDSNKYGIDTLEYVVNNAKTGRVIITISAVNDKTVFTSVIDSILVLENTSDTVIFRANDIDVINTKLIVNKIIPYVTIKDSLDSLAITIAPTWSVASKLTTPFRDTLIIKAIDSKFGDTLKHRLIIKVQNVNRGPVFTAPIQVVSNTEGISKVVNYKAVDPDGDIVEIVLSKASDYPWILTSGSDGTLDLTLKPGFDLATNQSSHLRTVTLKATDGVDTTSLAVQITIINKNRLPYGIMIDKKDSTEIGKIAQFSVTANDSDLQDVVRYELTGTILPGVTINSTTGRISWDVLNYYYTVGSSPRISLRITDGFNHVDTAFTIKIIKHTWTNLNENTRTRGVFAALNKDTIFSIYELGVSMGVCKSVDAGNMFSTNYLIKSNGYISPEAMEIFNGNINIVGGADLSGMPRGGHYIEMTTNGIINDSVSLGVPPSTYSLNNYTGEMYVAYGSYMGGTNNHLLYRKNGKDSVIIIGAALDELYTGGTYSWATFRNVNGLYMTNRIDISKKDTLGFTKLLTDTNNILWITGDNNDGDTIYVARSYNYSPSIYRITSSGVSSYINSYSLDGSVQQVLMANGKTGWILTSAGSVYFSNDGLATFTKEEIVTNKKIRKLFLASDKKAVFAYGVDETVSPYTYGLYRY
jgi:hypothetical protein